jgi:hypothetical protein
MTQNHCRSSSKCLDVRIYLMATIGRKFRPLRWRSDRVVAAANARGLVVVVKEEVVGLVLLMPSSSPVRLFTSLTPYPHLSCRVRKAPHWPAYMFVVNVQQCPQCQHEVK